MGIGKDGNDTDYRAEKYGLIADHYTIKPDVIIRRSETSAYRHESDLSGNPLELQ